MDEVRSQAAGGAASAAQEHLRDLQAVSEAALAHLGLSELLAELLDRVQAILNVDTVAVLLLDSETNELVAHAAKGLEEDVASGTRIPVGAGFAGQIVSDRTPRVVHDVAQSEVLNPVLLEKGVASLLGVPLVVQGEPIGVLHVGSLQRRDFTKDDEALLQLVADRAAVAIDHARLFEAEREATRAAQAVGLRLTRLEAVTEAALAHLSLDELLDELLVRLRFLLSADTAAVLLLDPDRGELVARAAKGLEEEVRRGVRIPVGAGFAGRVAAEARPIEMHDPTSDDVVNPILLETGIRAILGVPLVVEGRVIGVLHVGMLSPRTFSEDDKDLLQLAADRIAVAIDHARLYDAERRARKEAEEAADRIERLQSISEVALSHLALDDDLLNDMLARLRDNLNVDTAVILLLDAASNELVARAAKGLEEEVERGVRIPVGEGFAGSVAARREPVAIEDLDRAFVVNPILRSRGVKSLLGVPLLVDERVLGVLHVGSFTLRRFTEQETTFLQLAADRIAVALDHARLFEREHMVAATLQRSLLPEHLPRVPGVALAARYMPGEGETQLGGDWYDAMILPDGRLAVALGDVVSRGLRAAAVTAQLRNALRAYAIEGHGPSELLNRLSKLTRTLERREMATLVYLVFDPDGRRVVAASAGHPPPLLLDPQGRARYLETPQMVPLGALADPQYREVEFELEPGSLLVAFTDGLVERRDLWIDEGMDALREAAEGRGHDVESFCDEVIAAMLGGSGNTDDIAVIAVGVVGVPDRRIVLDFPANADELSGMRRALRQWLAGVGAGGDESYELLVASTEAAANAVEHAYGPVDATFRVEASIDDGEVEVKVSDRGRWRPPRGTNRGRGTMLMQELVDLFEVKTGDNGTEVLMRKRLAGA